MKTIKIERLDQLEPGMKRVIDGNFTYASYEVMHKGGGEFHPWTIDIQYQKDDTPTRCYFNDRRVERIFLNQEVEVPE